MEIKGKLNLRLDMVKRGELEGGFTVEAALVVPVVIGCMLFVILTAFSLHDHAVLRAAAAETVTGGLPSDGESARRGLLYYRNYAWETEVREERNLMQRERVYHVRFRTEANDLIGRLTGALVGTVDMGGLVSVQGEAKYVRTNPVKLIWSWQVLLDQAEGRESADESQISLGER